MKKAVRAAIAFSVSLLLLAVIVSPAYSNPCSPQPTILPSITISRTGSIQSSLNPVPITMNGREYALTENIYNYCIDIQCSGITLNGAGYWVTSNVYNLNTGISVEANQVNITNVNIQGFPSAINITGSYNIVSQTHSTAAIDLEGNHNVITENNITRSVVNLFGSSNSISENILYSSTVALWNRTSFNTITGNTFNVLNEDKTINGISICGNGMESNAIYLNNFMNKIAPIIDVSNPSQAYSGNRFDNGSVGNYWSDYATKNPNAKEVANTGIYNIPYTIYVSITDNYPLTTPYIQDITVETPKPTPLPTAPSRTDNPFSILSIAIVIAGAILAVITIILPLMLYRRHRKTTSV